MKTTKNKSQGFLRNLLSRVTRHDLSTMAAAMSYYYLSASIPLMLVLTSLVGKYLGGNRDLLLELVEILPSQTQDLVISMIDSLMNSPNSSSLSIVTLIFAVWSASNGIFKLLDSINTAYGSKEAKSGLATKILSFLYTFALIFVILILMGIRIYGPRIIEMVNNFLDALGLDPLIGQIGFLIKLISLFLPLIVMSLGLGLLYKIAANRDKDLYITYKEGLKGGVLATVIIYVASFLYSFFLDNMSSMPIIYGTLAGVLSLFVWILIFSYSIILGAELIAVCKELEKGQVEDMPKELEEKIKRINERGPMKKEIRRYFLNYKRRLPKKEKEEMDRKICDNILESDLYKKSKSIFVYLSMPDEIDTREFIKKALNDGKEIYVPKITGKRDMKPVLLESLDDLIVGEYDIETSKSDQTIESTDLSLVPGLAFDQEKYRIGFGGGYYDKYMKDHNSTYLGMFYEDSYMDKIPRDSHDMPLDFIVTEKEIR